MYFDSQPNFYYPYKGGIKISKNLFRRVRFRDNLNALYVASTKYTIQNGETPEIIAKKKYGSPEWYWTILILNNIIDMNNDWPVSDYELDLAIEKKYGQDQSKVKFWETKQIYTNGNLDLQGGIIIEYNEGRPEQQAANYYPTFTFKGSSGEHVLAKITNREYEYRENEKKKDIFLIKQEYLNIMKEEIETLFAYDTSYKIDQSGIRFSETP